MGVKCVYVYYCRYKRDANKHLMIHVPPLDLLFITALCICFLSCGVWVDGCLALSLYNRMTNGLPWELTSAVKAKKCSDEEDP